MNPTKPLVIVKSLKGTGVNPAIANRVIQAITPPSEENFSFKNEVLSTPYSSKIFIPISLKKTKPIKYPSRAPKTDPVVATKAILTQSFFFCYGHWNNQHIGWNWKNKTFYK